MEQTFTNTNLEDLIYVQSKHTDPHKLYKIVYITRQQIYVTPYTNPNTLYCIKHNQATLANILI